MIFHVTALYAALLGLLTLVLAAMVSMQRAKYKQSISDGGHPDLSLAIRRHGNLIEYLPLFLILLGLCEARGMSTTWLHVLGIVFLLSRIAHVVGLHPTNGVTPARGIAVIGTDLAILATILYLLWTQFALA
jgi:uncharacterized membrane protein YecN with MAPEG domain